MQCLVMKFGGTSLGDAQRIDRAADAVADARGDGAVAVVVSAMTGVTDRLVGLIGAARAQPGVARAAIEAIIDSHRTVARELGIGTIDAAPWSIERLHERLRERGIDSAIVPAEVLIRTHVENGDVEVDGATTRANICTRGDTFWRPLVRIVPGFTAADADAHATTLGRNASDYSAAWLACALGWPLEIRTDVAGCYSADPRHVPGTRLLRRLSLVDAHRFARSGASVIHARTLEPLLADPVPLSIVNSFASSAERSRIGAADSEILRGVARRDDLRLLRGAGALAAIEAFDRGRDVVADCAI
ncbi:MAG: hypothetical protein ABI650_03000, partial [Dokdonella sp.]